MEHAHRPVNAVGGFFRLSVELVCAAALSYDDAYESDSA